MKRWLTGLSAFLYLAPAAFSGPIEVPIANGFDDGEEVDDQVWYPDASPLCLGSFGDGHVHNLGLRFVVPNLAAADSVLFARLRFSARGSVISDGLSFQVAAASEVDSPPLTSERRPSQLPHTQNSLTCTLTQPWLDGGTDQLFYYTGDLSGIINEVISLPGWRGGSCALVFCLDDLNAASGPANFVICSDLVPQRWPVTLQICRNLTETFLCPGLLGRPTDHSVTINFASLLPLEVYAEYGVGNLNESTTPVIVPAGLAYDLDLVGLAGNTRYNCRLRYRRAGSQNPYDAGLVHSFQTQRPPGATFAFTTQADSHTWESWEAAIPEADALKLYARTLDNVSADGPDFHFSLGDFSMTAYAQTYQNAWDRYQVQRRYLDEFLPSVPFYLVTGNHEGELGWVMANSDSTAVWAERSRRALVPDPYPDGFYDGCPEPATTGTGFRESYCSWEWGDALFVVLDPYWYTTERPWHNENPEEGGGWAWTLGLQQYEWLHQTLSQSDRTWKIVLFHNLVGGIAGYNDAYGRGGIEAVKWAVAQKPSFEWGGDDFFGLDNFTQKRPEFLHGPIHDMLVADGVKLVIKGHDHFCAFQELDGITYVTCPQPTDRFYTYGEMPDGQYSHGVLLPNSGHLRFVVSPGGINIEYVKAYLPGEGPNGTVAYSYLISAPLADVAPPVLGALHLRVTPNPASGRMRFTLVQNGDRLDGSSASLRIYDVAGRLQATLLPQPDGSFLWDQENTRGRPVPSGVYECLMDHPGGLCKERLVVVR